MVLAAARTLAKAKRISLGQAVSQLALRGLSVPHQAHTSDDATPGPIDVVYSPFPVLAGPVGHVVTDELVADHRDDG